MRSRHRYLLTIIGLDNMLALQLWLIDLSLSIEAIYMILLFISSAVYCVGKLEDKTSSVWLN